MKKRSQIVNFIIASSIVLTNSACAEDTRSQQYTKHGLFYTDNFYQSGPGIHPYAKVGLLYSDNVSQTSEDVESSFITSLEAGLYSKFIGNKSDVEFIYTAEQLIYSHDSNKNDVFHQLLFSADHEISKSGFKFDSIATIVNIPRYINDNANADIYSDNTIESRNAEVGLSFSTNPRSDVDLNMRTFGVITDNEDGIGNYTGYGATLFFNNGMRQKTLFWQTSTLYDEKSNREDDSVTKRTYLDWTFGYQTDYKLSPMLRMNYENYTGISYSDIKETFSWGPGVRYFLTRNSYFDLSYNFSEKENISDFWGGGFNLEPSPRLLVNFSYGKRYFGDAYDFTLEHRSRKMLNTITYREDTNNFEREFYSSDEDIEVFTLNRRLEWLTELRGKRDVYGFKIFYHEQEPLSDDGKLRDEKWKGISLSAQYALSRRLEVNTELLFSRYDFNRTGNSSQDDEYIDFVFRGHYEIYKGVFSTLEYEYNDRSSNITSRDYDENRISIDFRMVW